MKLVPAEQDGVVPDGYHATTLFPEYYHLDGRWVLAEDSRMDCVAVARNGRIEIVEFRNVKAGDPVVVGRTEDGSEGIYIHPNCFADEAGNREAFAFRTRRAIRRPSPSALAAAGRPPTPSTMTSSTSFSATSGNTETFSG